MHSSKMWVRANWYSNTFKSYDFILTTLPPHIKLRMWSHLWHIKIHCAPITIYTFCQQIEINNKIGFEEKKKRHYNVRRGRGLASVTFIKWICIYCVIAYRTPKRSNEGKKLTLQNMPLQMYIFIIIRPIRIVLLVKTMPFQWRASWSDCNDTQ